MAAKFEIKRAKNGQFSFHLRAGNGQIILASEMYKEQSGAARGIASVRKSIAKDQHFERKTAKNGKPYFVLKAANGEIIGSSQMYVSAKGVEKDIAAVKRTAPEALVVESI